MIYSANLLKIMGTKCAADLLDQKNVDPYQKLWRHVILNAFEDVSINNTDRKSAILKWASHHWILDSKDFETVSWWSGWDPEYVRNQYRKALNENLIYFTDKHLKWKRYVELFEKLKSEKNPEERKELRRYVLIARRDVARSEDLVIKVI